jgi:predicted outer membrane repeat protein
MLRSIPRVKWEVRHATNRRPRLRTRLLLQGLEERATPALFVVSNLLPGGAGSLSEAIALANDETANPGLDTITFSVSGTIPVTATLSITSDITFNGPGVNNLIIDGENNVQVFNVSLGVTQTKVTFTDLTITRGLAVGTNGGGISANGCDLTLTNVAITKCSADLLGGGVFVNNGAVSITGSTISNNSSLTRGGGLTVQALSPTTIQNTTISGNTSTNEAGGIYFNNPATGVMHKMTNVTVADNISNAGLGGAIRNNGGLLEVSNCLITGNKSLAGGTYTALFHFGGQGLTLSSSTISLNSAVGATGGVRFNTTAPLVIDNCLFFKNTSTNGGSAGALVIGSGATNASVSITNSRFVENTTVAAGGNSGNGGAIRILPAINTTISNCTFEKNFGGSAGGAIFYASPVGVTHLVENCTFDSNSTNNSGGAISSSGDAAGGTILIRNSTFFNNTAPSGAGGALRAFSFGGNIVVENSTVVGNSGSSAGGLSIGSVTGTLNTPTMTILSSIVAQNLVGANPNSVNADVVRTTGTGAPTPIVSVDFSVVGVVAATPQFTEPTPGSNLKGNTTVPFNPQLGPLANNGGFGKTMIPLPGSPVINAGKANLLVTPFDQRGVGFPRDFGGGVDMGAIEAFNPAPVVANVNAPSVTSGAATTYEFELTFTDNNAIDVNSLKTVGAVTVSGGKFASPVDATFVSVDNPTNGTPRTAKFSITPPGGSWDVADNGIYTINITANKIFDTDLPTPLSVPAGAVGTFLVGYPITFVVNATNDEFTDTDGKLSLREAILAANASPGADIIVFDEATVFTFPQVIGYTNGQINITDSVTIIGPAQELTLNAQLQSNHFNITNPSSVITVNISKLTFLNGQRTSNAFGQNGGSINGTNEILVIDNCKFDSNFSALNGSAIGMVGGKLTVTNSLFTGNSVQFNFNFGGTVAMGALGELTIGNCTFTSNFAEGSGGAIRAEDAAKVQITNSVFSGNQVLNQNFVGGAMFIGGATVVDISGSQFVGNEQTNGGGGSGGGIAINGSPTITINKTLFDANKSNGGDGGGFWANAAATATIVMNDCTFTDNEALFDGGAVRIGGNSTLTVNRTTIADNKAGESGAGIAMEAGGSLTVNASTLSGNIANLSGGGIYSNGGTGAALVVSNSTLSGNEAQFDGGAIMVNSFGAAATVTIRNSTVAFNKANFGVTGGGGIALQGNLGAVTLSSTIVAENTAAVDAVDFASDLPVMVMGQNNLVGIADKGNINYEPGNPLNGTMASKTNPLLDTTLKLNGAPAGSTLTHALLPGSPAIDAGNNAAGLITDQRGPGFARVSGGKADIGAYEVQVAAPPPTISGPITINGGIQRSMVQTITITFSEPVTIMPGAFQVQGTALGPIGNVGLNIMQSGNVVTLTFNNTGVAIDPAGSLQDGKYKLSIFADKIMGSGGATLDGNNNGTAQGSPVDDVTFNFHRLFGDANGDGAVTATDFNAFRLDYGSPGPSIFDFDGVGGVTAGDFNNFRLRYGLSGYQP